jgi:DNA end-binding protein Ku
MNAMKDTGKIGIAQISIRSKSSLAAIRVLDECLAVETMFYPDEIRPIVQVPNLPGQEEVKEKELTMAKMLIEQLSTPFDAAKYTDQYRERLLDLIQHKVAGEEVRIAPTQPQTNVVDLMAALQASIEAVKPVVTDPGPAAKKRPARKPAAVTAQQAVAGDAISPAPIKKKRSPAKRKDT